MNPTAILTSVAILGGVGLAFGALIALAHRKLWVWEDPRIDTVVGLLPGTNCGACGYAGCHAFAVATIDGETTPVTCTVMAEPEVDVVAGYLGVDAGDTQNRVARLLCAGGSNVAPRKADYRGIESCAAAVAVGGGGKGCPWGCVGLADCVVSCTFDAMWMNEFDLPMVEPDKCTACGDCVDACPLDLYVLMPLDHHLIVQCRNLFHGEAATDVCSVACDDCGRCAKDAEPGLIEMRAGLAVIDYERIELAERSAVTRCPTGAILWLQGMQFAPAGDEDENRAGRADAPRRKTGIEAA